MTDDEVIEVGVTEIDPTLTVITLFRYVPLIVTSVFIGPEVGEMLVIDGESMLTVDGVAMASEFIPDFIN